MGQRLDLDAILRNCVGESGRVYFQPPASLKMQYPCIVYSRDNTRDNHADNYPYIHTKRYQVTVMDRDPDSEIPDKIALLPLCSFATHFTSDGLHHDVYNLYY